MEGHMAPITSVSFLPHGTRLVTGCRPYWGYTFDGTARVWGDLHWSPAPCAGGDTGADSPSSFSSDGNTGGHRVKRDGARVDVHRPPAPYAVRRAHGPSHFGVVLPHGTRLVTGSDDRTVRVSEVSTGRLLYRLERQTLISSLSFSPDGDVASHGLVGRRGRGVGGVDRLHSPPAGRAYGFDCLYVVFLTDGTRLVTRSCDGMVRLCVLEPPDPVGAIADVLRRTNLRVCRDSLVVIPVDITPATLRDAWGSSCRMSRRR